MHIYIIVADICLNYRKINRKCILDMANNNN